MSAVSAVSVVADVHDVYTHSGVNPDEIILHHHHHHLSTTRHSPGRVIYHESAPQRTPTDGAR